MRKLGGLAVLILVLGLLVGCRSTNEQPVTTLTPTPTTSEWQTNVLNGKYPYRAEIPEELKGKVDLAYNYGFSPSGKEFMIAKEWQISSYVKDVEVYEIVLDGNGNDISTYTVPAGEGNGVSLYYAYCIGPLDPEKWKTVTGIAEGHTNLDVISKLTPTPINSWTVEIKVTNVP